MELDPRWRFTDTKTKQKKAETNKKTKKQNKTLA